jgi:hypothetical protein
MLGMTFKTSTEAYSFYNDYAFIVRFSVVKFHTYKCKDNKDKNYGNLTRVTLKCNRFGRAKEEDDNSAAPGVQSAVKNKRKNSATPPTPNPMANKRKTSKLIPTQCPAELIVTLEKGGVWKVTRLNLDSLSTTMCLQTRIKRID